MRDSTLTPRDDTHVTMSLLPPVVAGAVFVVPHPFCWEMASKPGDDPEGPYSIEIMSWRPGVRPELRGHGEYHYTVEEYEGMGSQILTVVGVFRPGKYPTRVFYTRRWRDPDGKEFGKGGLRIKVMSAFKRIIGGYRHHEEPCLMAREATSVGEANTTTKELTDG